MISGYLKKELMLKGLSDLPESMKPGEVRLPDRLFPQR
jgi:hypothetical protein